jgi:hypothetical protein
MWNLFNCYLSGRHEFSAWCEPGTIFLRCLHCGRRSPGWALNDSSHVHMTTPAVARPPVAPLGRVSAGSHAS